VNPKTNDDVVNSALGVIHLVATKRTPPPNLGLGPRIRPAYSIT